jgi:hypothetical protein
MAFTTTVPRLARIKEWRPQTTTTEILSFAQNDDPKSMRDERLWQWSLGKVVRCGIPRALLAPMKPSPE